MLSCVKSPFIVIQATLIQAYCETKHGTASYDQGHMTLTVKETRWGSGENRQLSKSGKIVFCCAIFGQTEQILFNLRTTTKHPKWSIKIMHCTDTFIHKNNHLFLLLNASRGTSRTSRFLWIYNHMMLLWHLGLLGTNDPSSMKYVLYSIHSIYEHNIEGNNYEFEQQSYIINRIKKKKQTELTFEIMK